MSHLQTLQKWKEDFLALKEYKVIKYGKVFQVAFYILKYEREQICYRDTNLFCWKKAHKLINDEFFERMKNYNPIGPKPDDFKKYQMNNFLSHFLTGYT